MLSCIFAYLIPLSDEERLWGEISFVVQPFPLFASLITGRQYQHSNRKHHQEVVEIVAGDLLCVPATPFALLLTGLQSHDLYIKRHQEDDSKTASSPKGSALRVDTYPTLIRVPRYRQRTRSCPAVHLSRSAKTVEYVIYPGTIVKLMTFTKNLTAKLSSFHTNQYLKQ
jgi:hypothetical protein